MTPDDLVQYELIRRVKYAYCRLLDQKRFTELGELFTEEATATYGGGAQALSGRAEIVAFLTRAMASTSLHTSHLVGHPEIDLDGPDRATGSWALQDLVLVDDTGFVVRGASYYTDRYVRVAGGRWLIAHTGYRRLFEELAPRAPGATLTASWWGTDGRSSLGG